MGIEGWKKERKRKGFCEKPKSPKKSKKGKQYVFLSIIII